MRFYIILIYGLFCCLACQNTDKPSDSKVLVSEKVNPQTNTKNISRTPNKTVETITMDTSISTAHLMGQFNPTKDDNFVEIAIQYADRPGQLLHKDTYEAFKKMHQAAKESGINLVIKSATRNFDAQKRIWEGKWGGKRLLEGKENAAKKYPNPTTRALKILEYSSMPGTSRHHWGTDIDLNAFVNSYFEKGQGLKEYEWLVNNAPKFGFCQPYTPKGPARPHGYNEEKWHWSYLPLAKKLSDQYKTRLTNEDIKGFKGSDTAELIDVVQKYVLGINKDCL